MYHGKNLKGWTLKVSHKLSNRLLLTTKTVLPILLQILIHMSTADTRPRVTWEPLERPPNPLGPDIVLSNRAL